MTIKVRTNLVSGIIFLIMAIALLILIPKEIVQTYQQNQYIDAKAIPQLIAYFMLAVSISLILKGTVFKKEVIKEFELAPELVGLGFICILALYVFAMKYIGLLFDSIILATITLSITKVKKWKIWVIVMVSIVIVYFAFTFGLSIYFPRLIK